MIHTSQLTIIHTRLHFNPLHLNTLWFGHTPAVHPAFLFPMLSLLMPDAITEHADVSAYFFQQRVPPTGLLPTISMMKEQTRTRLTISPIGPNRIEESPGASGGHAAPKKVKNRARRLQKEMERAKVSFQLCVTSVHMIC